MANPALEAVCLWQPGEGCDPEGVPCKGFMGTILFLSKTSTPLVIEGEVRVYLFDDQGTPEENTKPLRMFNFDNGSWAIHLTSTSFGPTYTVFIPYVRRGVSNAACTLRVRLKPKAGPVVFSEFANMQLNGPKKASAGEDAKPITKEEVDRETVDVMTKSLLRTTTIAAGPNQQSMQAKIPSKVDTDANKVQTALHQTTAGSNPIQLATHQTSDGTTKESADAERIRRLEAMVEKLLEQQSAMPAKPMPAGRIRQEREPARLDDDVTPPDSDMGAFKPDRRLRIRRNEDDILSRSSAARRHPLEMEETPSTRLSDNDEIPETPSNDELESVVEANHLPKPTTHR